jgi:phage tail sheath gpL-like
MLADMVQAYRLNDPTGELWCVPVPAGAGAAAAGSVTFAGSPTTSGLVAVYIAGQRYAISVASGAIAADLATALAAAIAADPLAPIAATAAAAVVDLAVGFAGEIGNDLQLALNLRGVPAGEVTPAGLTVTLAPFAGGAGTPDVAPSLAALADAEYDYVAIPWADAATLDDVRTAFGEESGRWAWDKQLYGHAFSARVDDVATLVTDGSALNDPHTSVLGVPTGAPTAPWRIAAAFTAEAAVGLRDDPARPLQTLPLVGVQLPPRGSRFTVGERQTLLFHGIATCVAGSDNVARIERAITTYQRNAYDQPDPSWLDVQTPATLQYIVRTLRNAILTKYPRHKLANDGTHFGAGQAIVTPKILKAELVAQYAALEDLGMVENMDAFKTFLIVERDPIDPNRVNVLLPPDLVNQLRVFAALVQFRLQYSPQALASTA